MIQIEFRSHYARYKFPWQKDKSLQWRVRCRHWNSDIFRVISKEELQKVQDVCELMSIPFIDLDTED